MAGGPSEFLQRSEELIGASGWRTIPSPSLLLEQWHEFVEICNDGYSATIYEYENERSVRDLLEKLMQDPILQQFQEMEALRQQVGEIDWRFQEQSRDEVAMADNQAPWWHQCVPSRADGEFAEDLRSKFGIEPLT